MTAAPTSHLPEPFDTRVVIPDIDAVPHGDPEAVRLVFGGDAFGTGWRTDLFVAPGAANRLEDSLPRRIRAWLDLIDRQMSPYRVDSDLTRFNESPAGTFVPLPQVMMQVLRHAIDMAHLTGGAFDPGLLAAVELWGFGPRIVPQGLPQQADIEALKGDAHSWRRLDWRPDGLVRPAGFRLDLNAIAKGYAVDGLCQMLQFEQGVSAALVEIGGELRGFGARPDDLPWWVEIEAVDTDAPRTVVAISGRAVATSGDLRRSFEHEGLILSHTIDARTACPARPEVASATVIDAQAWRADALATALIVMGEAEARAFAKRHGIGCLLRVRDSGGIREVLSPVLESWV